MKKIIVLAFSIMVLVCSCYSYKQVSGQTEFDNYKTRKSVHVLKVVTKTDSLLFSGKMPANMLASHVFGYRQYPLEHMTRDSVFFKPQKYKRTVEYIYKDGIRYDAIEFDGHTYVYDKSLPLTIPYSDVDTLYLKIFEPGRSAAIITVSSVVAVVLLLKVTLWNMDPLF